jgi:hypothetical protein
MPVTLRFAAAVVAVSLALVPATAAAASSSNGPVGSGAGAATAAGTPVSLAVVVPLTVKPTGAGLLDSATLAADTAPLGTLSRQLDAIIGTPAVIGIDPMIIASIQVLGTAAPTSALTWLARLRDASNETFALGYADADPASLARIDALALKDPLGFDFAIDPGHFGPAVTATPTATGPASEPTPSPAPTVSAAPTTPALPTSAQDVLAWSYTVPNVAWPAEDTVIGADLDELKAAGYHRVILNSTNVSSTDSALVDLGDTQGIVADAGVSTLVRAAVGATTTASQQDALGRLNSALAGLEAVSPGRTVVATLDRHWSLGSADVASLYADLSAQLSVIPVGLSGVLQGAHPSAKITDEAGDPSRVPQVRSLVAASKQEVAFSSVANTPTLVTEPRRLQLLSLLAVSWEQAPLGTGAQSWATAVASYLTASTKLTSSVQIVTGSNLSVFAGQTNFPVTVSNALSVPVTVYVSVFSPSSILQVQKQDVALVVEPGSSNKAAIPVQALTNGKVTTSVTIRSGDGLQVGTQDYVKVDLQPGWEGVGTTVVVALLVLIFGGGLVRNILKRRRRRVEDAGAAGD